jgi:hypothetical protein
MRKAQELARRETERLNGVVLSDEASAATEISASDEEVRTICHNGKCTWKRKEKYDNVHKELTGYSSSEEE